MTLEEYQNFVSGLTSAKIIEVDDVDFETSWATLGLVSEAGEVAGVIAKEFRKNGLITEAGFDKIVDELGDTLWYLVAVCNATGVKVEDVLNHNVKKLKKRDTEGTLYVTSR